MSVKYARLLGDLILKFIVMSEKDGCQHGIKISIIYYIFHTLIPKSVLVFHTFAPTSFDDSSFITARLQFVICRLPFWCLPVSLLTFRTFWGHYSFTYFEQSRFQILPSTIHAAHPRSLADSSCMVKAVQQHKDYQQQFQKKEMCKYYKLN